MDAPQVLEIGQDLLYTALLVALPTLLASLIVGLVFSILQTITSIQEQTLTFIPAHPRGGIDFRVVDVVVPEARDCLYRPDAGPHCGGRPVMEATVWCFCMVFARVATFVAVVPLFGRWGCRA